jgi:hypothetical protein
MTTLETPVGSVANNVAVAVTPAPPSTPKPAIEPSPAARRRNEEGVVKLSQVTGSQGEWHVTTNPDYMGEVEAYTLNPRLGSSSGQVGSRMRWVDTLAQRWRAFGRRMTWLGLARGGCAGRGRESLWA